MKSKGVVVQMAGLLAAAGAAAVISNAMAGPTRRLSWRPAPRLRPAAEALRPVPAPVVPEVAPEPLSPVPRRPQPTAHSPQPKPPQPNLPLKHRFPPPADGAPFEIDGAAALALHQAGARFVDSRRTAAFEEGHIAGALGLPLWEDGLEAKLQAADASTKDPEDPLIIYCTGGDCRDSHDLAQRFWELGYRNLRIYRGGWPEWAAKGWPSAKGPK